jgi:hypothetical protein
MRRGRDNGWLTNDESGDFMGVNLGSDQVAEHEWGIKGIKQVLGVPGADEDNDRRKTDYGGVYGMDRRRCKSPKPDCVALHEEGDTLNLIVMKPYSLKSFLEYGFDRTHGGQGEWRFWTNDTMVTAWDESSFAIRVKGEENFKKLRELHEALMKGECCIWLGGGGVFQNAGLCIAIHDRIPEKHLKTMREGDMDHEKLNRAAAATGIQKKIEDANEQWRKMQEVESGSRFYGSDRWGYYALSPRWAHKEERKRTKHPVIFWLNPMDQERNNYGWFTVEQLEQWLQGNGPIPKEKSKQRRKR